MTDNLPPSPSPRRCLRLDRKFLAGVLVGIVVVVAGVGITAAGGGLDDDIGEIESIAPGALNITDTQARAAVQEAYPEASIEEVDLDTQSDGSLVYDVSLDNGKEIMVDAKTGDVLGEEADDSDAGDEDEGDAGN